MNKLTAQLLASVLLIFSAHAQGDPVRWYLQGVTMSDGARAIGSFVFDADTGAYSEVDIVSTIGDSAAGSTYSDPNPDSPGNENGLLIVQNGAASPLTGQPIFTIEYSEPLADSGGTVTVKTDGFSYEGVCGTGTDMRECGSIIPARTFASGTISSTVPGAFISAAFNGAWFNAATPGQGVLLDFFPALPLGFLAWFTDDVAPAPDDATAVIGDPNHRWLTAQGAFRVNEAVLDVYLTTGGIFDDPTQVTNSAPNSYGRIVLTFTDDCRSGTMEYNLFNQPRIGSFPIIRLADDNVNLCLQLAGTAAASGPDGRLSYQYLPDGSFNFSEIHQVRPDGRGDMALTDDGGNNYDPAPSPDGGKIAFSSANVIQLMDADGGNRTALASGRFPDFSPDGTSIVYSDNGIHVMDLEGELQDSPRGSGDMPDWSPDGSSIAFREAGDIWVMNADGSGTVNLTQDGVNTSSSSPRWSPDGEEIVFERCEGAWCRILIIDRSGGNLRNLTNGEVNDFLPDWSPNGAWISFERYSNNSSDIWIARRDGSVLKRVTTSGKASTAKWGRTPD